MHLIDHGRTHIEKTYKRPFGDRFYRNLLSQIMPYPLRFKIVGITDIVSTLLTVVGNPYKPTPAGNGGFSLGWPFLPSKLSNNAVSSPQM